MAKSRIFPTRTARFAADRLTNSFVTNSPMRTRIMAMPKTFPPRSVI